MEMSFSDSCEVMSMYWMGPAKHWAFVLVHWEGGASRQVYSPLGGRARILVPPVCTPLQPHTAVTTTEKRRINVGTRLSGEGITSPVGS